MNNVCTSGASAGWADARCRDAGHVRFDRRGAATKQMPARRRAPSGRGPRLAGFCCLLLTYYRYARRRRLASEPGGQQQNVNVIH